MGDINPDAWLTRSQAAMYAGVSTDTVGKWHARGWLTPSGERRHLTVQRRPDGTLRYRLGDVVDAERDTRNNANSPRNPLRPRPAGGPGSWADLNRQSTAA